MEDWNIDDESFDDGSLETSQLNQVCLKVIDKTEKVLSDMKENLRVNADKKFENNLDFLVKRLTELTAISMMDRKERVSDSDISKMMEDLENHVVDIDFNKLFQIKKDDDQKHGLDIIDYLAPKKDGPENFDF